MSHPYPHDQCKSSHTTTALLPRLSHTLLMSLPCSAVDTPMVDIMLWSAFAAGACTGNIAVNVLTGILPDHVPPAPPRDAHCLAVYSSHMAATCMQHLTTQVSIAIDGLKSPCPKVTCLCSQACQCSQWSCETSQSC